ncbi:MAG: chemotaxis protein CheW [Deltaproteobacteria bacterium]|nr:chemotaxis protein CheW [Deltaproteobacteria bacterium]
MSTDHCWSTIGIEGDHSCPELAAVIHCRNCPVFARAARQVLERPAPDDYLAQWAARLALPEDEEQGETRSLVVFVLAGRHFALPTATFVEAVEVRPVHVIPHRRGVLTGLANIRGELQLCVSLPALLALPAADSAPARPRLAVIEHDEARWAFAVDDLLGVQRVEVDDLTAPPADAHPLVAQHFPLRAVTVALLDESRLGAALRQAVA